MEITALVEGLNWAYLKGISKIVIEGDSRIILDGIVTKRFSNWKLDTWSTRIGLLLSKFDDFRVQHIFQEGNKVADFLANQGISDDLTTIVSKVDDSCRELQVLISEDCDQIPRDDVSFEGGLCGTHGGSGFLLEDASSESDKDAQEVVAVECSRKVEFMAKALEVFRAGVVNIDMGPF
ncbi:hypothetical protein SUGI_0927970 [Cryptomeria japonica]|nr:hypothetical protein SUGI_0927970 [Cryptomeria japonica]